MLAQHYDDENVGKKGDGDYEGHEVPVNWKSQLGRPLPRRAVDVITV